MGSAQNPITLNRFLYAGANPATMIDPDGHTFCNGHNDDTCDRLPPDPEQAKKVEETWHKKQRQRHEEARHHHPKHDPVHKTGAPGSVHIVFGVLVGPDGAPLSEAGYRKLLGVCLSTTGAGLSACDAVDQYNRDITSAKREYCSSHAAQCEAANEATLNVLVLAFWALQLLPSEGSDIPEVEAAGAELSAGIEAGAALEAEVAASRELWVGEKIANQMGPRGWTEELLEDTVNNPVQRHPVWDLTAGTRQPATAYVRADSSYVVVNDSSGAIVQVSNINDPNWKPVWNDPQFQR